MATFVVATQPSIAKSQFVEGLLWSLLVLIALAGWGSLLARATLPGRRVDLGLLVTWGGASLILVGGVLTAAGAYRRTTAMVLVDVGLLAAMAALVTARRSLVARLRLAVRSCRHDPLMTIVLAGALALTALCFVAAVGDERTNVYDDDIAYFPLVKKLVQIGSMAEPFSFRRLSALGGQPFFLSLLYPHASFQQMNAFDRGICLAGVVALILGYRRERRRPPAWVSVLAIVFFLTLPNISINTGSHFSGVLFFLGLFRTMQLVDELPAPGTRLDLVRRAALPALVAAGACTLRQNFIAPAVIAVAAGEIFAFFRSGKPWRERLVGPGAVAGIAGAALVPWLVLSYRSSGTPLYPFILGTYNRSLVLTSSLFTWLDEVRLFIDVAVDNEPIETLSLFVIAALLVRETTPQKPLRSFWIGCAVGYAILTHSLSQGDAGNLARYMFGFLTALALATILTAGSRWHGRASTGRERFVGVLVMVAIAGQLVVSKEHLSRRWDALVSAAKSHVHDAAASPRTLRAELGVYAHVQSALPPGSKVAVMLDEPYYLDFARNDVTNLDMPGYASLPPGLPYFQGPESKAEYFLHLGFRYVMFVRSESSRAHYKREFWFARMFAPEEIWRLFSPYQVDMIDDLAALAKTHKILAEERGIVALDLGSPP